MSLFITDITNPFRFPVTGCIEGFFKAENCKENVVENINTISLFCVPESVIKFRLSPRS